jgi:hypothetical protein
MTYTVELKNEHALRLLEELEQLGVLTIQDKQPPSPDNTKQPTFTAMSYSTKGFKFNRDEANER